MQQRDKIRLAAVLALAVVALAGGVEGWELAGLALAKTGGGDHA